MGWGARTRVVGGREVGHTCREESGGEVVLLITHEGGRVCWGDMWEGGGRNEGTWA